MDIDFSRFTTISFDCYGTLVDWESGILPVLRAVLSNHGQVLADAKLLELYGEFEADAEAQPYRSYREVLRTVAQAFARRLHFEATPEEIDALHESVSGWMPFPDTAPALLELKKHYKLAVISNIDDDLFKQTRQHLGMNFDFDAVITAEQARSYKPSTNNFQMALRTLGISANLLLHAGQSIYHDVVPARSLGIATIWVNRRSARPGIGAVRSSVALDAEKRPDLEFPDLCSLAEAVLSGRRKTTEPAAS